MGLIHYTIYRTFEEKMSIPIQQFPDLLVDKMFAKISKILICFGTNTLNTHSLD